MFLQTGRDEGEIVNDSKYQELSQALFWRNKMAYWKGLVWGIKVLMYSVFYCISHEKSVRKQVGIKLKETLACMFSYFFWHQMKHATTRHSDTGLSSLAHILKQNEKLKQQHAKTSGTKMMFQHKLLVLEVRVILAKQRQQHRDTITGEQEQTSYELSYMKQWQKNTAKMTLTTAKSPRQGMKSGISTSLRLGRRKPLV